MHDLVLRPVDDADLGLLASWLNREHVLKWFHNADDWLHEINERHNRFSWITHYIVMDGAVPVGFCQYYDCYDARTFEDWYNVARPGDAFSIDYLIGDETRLGKGYGKEIVNLLSNAIAATGNARRIIVQPDKENHASRHVLLANGYVYDEELGYYCKLLKQA